MPQTGIKKGDNDDDHKAPCLCESYFDLIKEKVGISFSHIPNWEIYQVKDLYIAMYANDWMDMSDETRVTSIPFTVE